MGGIISGCVPLFVSGAAKDIIKKRAVIEESSEFEEDINENTEGISESPTVQVT